MPPAVEVKEYYNDLFNPRKFSNLLIGDFSKCCVSIVSLAQKVRVFAMTGETKNIHEHHYLFRIRHLFKLIQLPESI